MKKKIIYTVIFAIAFICIKSSYCKAIQIPKVYFEGDISNMTNKKDERKIKIKYESTEINFEKYAKIKIQGSSSIVYEKKNYTINLYETQKYEEKANVGINKNWGAHSKYNLKANWIDKTHARNIVSAKIAGQIQRQYGVLNDLPNNGSIDGFPVELYINNEFLGLYTWNIPKDAWMWDMDENNLNHIVLEGEWYTEYTNFKTQLMGFDGTGWTAEVGNPNQDTINNFNRLIRFINDTSDNDFKRNLENYINKDACLNYIVMLYLIEGIDNTGKNMMMVTYNNGQTWYPCLYDLDSTWGTWTDGKLNESYEILPENDIVDHSTNNLIMRMIKCFPNEISDRWFELRRNIFSRDNIKREFRNFIDTIPEETWKKENERWENIPGYGIGQIYEFIDFRLDYIDSIMKERYTNIFKEFIMNFINLITKMKLNTKFDLLTY